MMTNIIEFKEPRWLGYGSEQGLINAIAEAEDNLLLMLCREQNPKNMFGGESDMWVEENRGRYPWAGRYLVGFSCPASNHQPDYFAIERNTLKIIHVDRFPTTGERTGPA